MLLIGGVLALAAHPASWLARSWFDPGYASAGEWIFGLTLALTAWSLSSPSLRAIPASDRTRAMRLLFATAAVRLTGEIMAVRTIGALALVVDVYAIGLALGLRHRRRSLSPAGLALLFSLSLPAERLVQRTFGYPLQLMSAKAACGLLAPLHDGLTCEGTLIAAEGAALSIDLPCSGAQGLVLLTALLAALVTLRQVAGWRLLAAAALTLGGAWWGNAIRLFVLAEGTIADYGVDVLAEPAHSVVGLLALLIAALPVLAISRPPPAITGVAPSPSAPLAVASPGWATVLGLLAVVGATFVAPAAPIDVSAAVAPVHLPLGLAGLRRAEVPLSDQEHDYFVRYGGAAAKASYGAHTAVVVRTAAPLRHLHAPDECLIGAGHTVHLEGVRASDRFVGPTAVYRSSDPAGAVWRVEVTFVDATGARATSPAHVAWRWFEQPQTSWTMLQRISPWAMCEVDRSACAAFDRALLDALDIPRRNDEESNVDRAGDLLTVDDRAGR